MTARIFLKILLATLLILALAMGGVDLLATRVAEQNYVGSFKREMAEKARLICMARAATPDPAIWLRMANEIGARLTIIDGSGRVTVDSQANAAQMENHAARPEFQQLKSVASGTDIRRSATTGQEYLYVAVPCNGGALRLAVPLAHVRAAIEAMRWKMLGSTALAFLPTILVAALFARRTSEKLGRIIAYAGELAKGNFRARLDGREAGELGVLTRQLREAGDHLGRAVEQLDREHSELEKLERVRRDFVINVSHELRTPLASIQGYTETLMDGAIDDEKNRMRFLAIIRQNAERLASLTSDLLTLSRVEMKRREFHFASYDLSEILAEAVDIVRPVADKKQLEIKQEIDPAIEGVYCDSEAVHQILINLLDNAIKYTPDNGEVTVRAEQVQSDGAPRVKISVIDSGIGIPPEDLPRLFERFYRVDKARSREMGGTGLGLAIVKHLVLAHGGEISVDSALGKGSAFHFTLSSTIYDAVTAV